MFKELAEVDASLASARAEAAAARAAAAAAEEARRAAESAAKALQEVPQTTLLQTNLSSSPKLGETPIFTIPLRDAIIQEGERFTFECR